MEYIHTQGSYPHSGFISHLGFALMGYGTPFMDTFLYADHTVPPPSLLILNLALPQINNGWPLSCIEFVYM